VLQTVLAVLPHGREVLGCAMQEAFVRIPIPTEETRSKRRQRADREPDVWMRLVTRLGSFASETLAVQGGDRGADMVGFFEACQATHSQFLVRVARHRRLDPTEDPQQDLLEQIRSWQATDSRPLQVPASHGRTARQSVVQLAFGPLTILPPRLEKRSATDPLSLWAIRVWEAQPPASEEPLEWLLLTSVPTGTQIDAWERVGWYECRWVGEDYHQCLKTGCRLQARQVQQTDRFIRLLGLLSPVALRLVQRRDLSRREPERSAHELVAADLLAVVAAQTGSSPQSMTTGTFWHAVARMGGYLARRHDGPPGWKTLSAGWLRAHTLLEGVHLVSQLRL
jgi:hypothetical protein